MAIRSPRPRRWREMRHFLAMRATQAQQGLAFSELFCRGLYYASLWCHNELLEEATLHIYVFVRVGADCLGRLRD